MCKFVSFLIGFTLFLSSQAIYVSHGNPYNQGSLTKGYLQISNISSLFGWLDVYYPQEPGTYAIILFMTGLDSDVPGGYDTIQSHFPTHGIISVNIQFILALPSDELYKTYLMLIDFLQANLSVYLPPGVVADVDNSLVGMGHSAGCKIVVKTLEETCSLIRGSILIQPVDGLDPWGWIEDFVTHPPALVNYTVPTLILGTGLGPVPGHDSIPACGPTGRNYERFFTCLNSNMWLLNATQFGHADLLDDFLWEGIYLTQFCKTTENTDARHYYQQFVAGSIAAFMIGVIQRNCPTLTYLTDTTTFPITEVVVDTSKLIDACPKPGCFHQ